MGLGMKVIELLVRKPRLPPKMIRKNLGIAKSTLYNCMVFLKEFKLIKNVNHGVFEATDWGKKVLETVENFTEDN